MQGVRHTENGGTMLPSTVPARAGGVRRWSLRVLAGILVLLGLVFIVIVPADRVRFVGPALWSDTLAYSGFGTDEGVPAVSQVRCSFVRRKGTQDPSFWDCTLVLESPDESPDGDPASRTAASPNVLKRELHFNHAGTVPRLRRLSAAEEPPTFGVIWDDADLAWRWSNWVLTCLPLWLVGTACLLGARLAWRPASRS